MQAVHRVAKNTGILYARMAITVFISLYATRLVLSALGAEDFGLFNVVGGVIAMLGFLNASMATATQRFMSFAQGSEDIEKVKRIFNMSTLLHAGIALVVVLAFEIAGYFFFHGILNIADSRMAAAKMIYQFMVISTFFTILSVPYEAVITSHENMMLYAVLGVLEALLKLGIAFYITYSAQDHLIVYGLLMAGLSVFLLVLRRLYCHRKYAECEIKIRHYYDRSLLNEMGSFAGWSLLGSSTSMIAFYGQGIVINMFFGTIVNAAQGIAGQISGQLGVFATTLMKALNPMIDKTEGAGNRKLMLKATMMGTKLSFFLLGILYIPFLIKMPLILGLWLKDVPEYTVVFCRLLLVRNLVEQLYNPLATSISAVGDIKNYQKTIGFFNFLPLIASYILFSFGFSPAYIYVLYLIYSLFMFFVTIYFAKKTCDLSIPTFFKDVVFKCLMVFIFSLAFSLISFLVFENKFLQLGAVIILGSLSFLTLIWLLGLSLEERNLMLNLKKLITQRVLKNKSNQ